MVSLFGHSRAGTSVPSESGKNVRPDRNDSDQNITGKRTVNDPSAAVSKEHSVVNSSMKVMSPSDENKPYDMDDEDSKERRNTELKKKSSTAKPNMMLMDPINDSQTQKNTRMNALLYHTSEESVNQYKRDNSASDLIGRLQYDDYTLEGTPTISRSTSPGGPTFPGPPQKLPSSDYFQSKIKVASASSPSIDSLKATRAQQRHPEIKRVKSFERGVSFEAETEKHKMSLMLKIKHPQFKFRRNNKTFLAGFNGDQESLKAIEWLLEQLVVQGDTVVILHVLDEKSNTRIDKERASKMLSRIELLNRNEKKIAIIYETVIGKPQKSLKAAIDEYKPAMMVIGTHHHNDDTYISHRFLSKSSMSKHFLESALVPVIVVKPLYKSNDLLSKPVNGKMYFQNCLANVDIPDIKDKHSRRTKPPDYNRTDSSGSLSMDFNDRERGRREADNENQKFRIGSPSRSRSSSRNRAGLSKFFHHS